MEELETLDKKEYELSVILAEEAGADAVLKAITAITENGGIEVVSKEIKAVELAYPIKKHRSAFLSSLVLKMVPANTHLLNAALRFMPEVLRSLTITPPIKKAVANRKPGRDYSDTPREPKEMTDGKSTETTPKIVKPEISSNTDLSKELEKLEAAGNEQARPELVERVESATN